MPDNNTDNQDNNNNNNNSSSNSTSSKQVVIGCDHNNNQDQEYIDIVGQIIEQGGYEVEKLPIGPNHFAAYSYDSSKASGKIGVFIIAVGLTSICDLYDGNTSFDYAYFGIRGGLNGIDNQSEFETKQIHVDKHGDCTSKSCSTFNGKTYPEINEATKSKCQAVFGATPEEMGNNILAAMGGNPVGGASSSGGSAVLIPDKTFYGLIKQIMGATDALFIIANNMAYLLSFKDIYEYRNQFDEYIPKIDPQDVIDNTLVKNYAVEGYYNSVEVEYADGIIKYQNDVLVKQYGENPFYYSFPEDDEETAKAKADALLAAHIRDYSSQIQMSIFFNENITVGSWVKVKKSLTNITGKTRKERQQEELEKKGEVITTKHKGINITNLTEKTVVTDGVTKKIRSITDEEGNEFDVEIEESEYELFFVQGFTCRWDKKNALVMDVQLKYGPDTPEDPINATIGTGGGGDTGAAIGGQAADINAFVQQCLGGSASQDRATAEKLYKCLCEHVVYHLYNCSDYSTPSDCYKYAPGGGTHDKGINCADTSRLVTACYKAAGFQAEVVWGPGHFWNEVKVGSETITVDVSSGSTGQHCTRAFGTKMRCGGSSPQKHEGDNPHC